MRCSEAVNTQYDNATTIFHRQRRCTARRIGHTLASLRDIIHHRSVLSESSAQLSAPGSQEDSVSSQHDALLRTCNAKYESSITLFHGQSTHLALRKTVSAVSTMRCSALATLASSR